MALPGSPILSWSRLLGADNRAMDFSRRGFFGLLGGALLAKIVGPRLISDPTPQLWEAAKVLPVQPIVNTYVPLEYVCAEALRIVNEELKWLRLRQVSDTHQERRFGDTIFSRNPLIFYPWDIYPERESRQLLSESHRAILLDEIAQATINLTTLDPECPLGHLSENYIEPAARQLAESVIYGVRRHGGGEVLATGALQSVDHARRCVIARSDELGLVIRATEWLSTPLYRQPGWRPELRIEMLYGLG
jgi:hypothetical protein